MKVIYERETDTLTIIFSDALVAGCSPANTLTVIWVQIGRQRGFCRCIFREMPSKSDAEGVFVVSLAHDLATETP
jgi:hypothetical protein